MTRAIQDQPVLLQTFRRLRRNCARLERVLFVSLAVVTGSCGSSPTANSSSSATFHAETSDPAGDAVSSPGVLSPPDLVHGTVDVANNNVTFTIQFAPGTVNSQTTRLTIELDTDQNPATGITGASGLGIDYVLDLWAARTNSQTLVQQAMPAMCAGGGACYNDVGTAVITLGTDTMSTTVPLAMTGNASGRMNLRIFAYASPQNATSTVADVMPDITLGPLQVP
jgi:hypothetical protein